jgi:hypothetical protein
MTRIHLTPTAKAMLDTPGEWLSSDMPGTPVEKTRALRRLRDYGYVVKVRTTSGNQTVWRTVRRP